MAARMVALNQLENGQFLSRKVIPIDVRDAYARLHGVRTEAQLRQPADTPRSEVKTRHAEWVAEIETRSLPLWLWRDLWLLAAEGGSCACRSLPQRIRPPVSNGLR
jgi:hypothetical protein